MSYVSKVKPILYLLFIVSSISFSIAASLSYFILSTHTGTQLAIKALPYLSDYSISSIEYKTVSGTILSNQLTFNGLHFQSPELDLYAKKVDLKISFLKLLSKQIVIQELIIDSPTVIHAIQYQSPDFDQNIKHAFNASQATQHFSWPNILLNYSAFDFTFSIEKFTLDHLHFVSGKQHYDIEQLTLTNLNSQNKKPFSTFFLKMPDISLNINLEKKIQLNWTINIHHLNQYFSRLEGDFHSTGQWDANNNHMLSFTLNSRQVSFDTFTADHLNLSFNYLHALNKNQNQYKLNTSLYHKKNKFVSAISGEINASQSNPNTTTLAVITGKFNQFFATHPKLKNIQPNKNHFTLVITPEKSLLTSDFTLSKNSQFILKANILHHKPFSINGTILGKIQELNLLTMWTNIKLSTHLSTLQLQGEALLKLDLNGTIIRPKITGEFILNKLTAKLAQLNTIVFIEKLGIYDLGHPKMRIHAIGKIGKGEFQLSGYAKQDPITPELQLTLKGSNLLISNTSEYKVFASPNLLLTVDKHSALLSGQLYIPQAKIMPLHNTANVITTSEDIVFVKNNKRQSADSTTTQSLKKLKTNLDIILGESVFFEGYGVTTQAKGRVIISTRQDNTAKATGKINLINGRYGVYGHYFSLSHGQLLFQSDPILDPKVDIRAEKIITPNMKIKNNASIREDIVVGIQIFGRLSKLQTKLYSNSPLQDREIISYLILGHGQNQNTGADGTILMAAITQLTHAFYPKSKRLTEKKSFYDRLKLDWNIGNSPFEDDTLNQTSNFEKKYVNIGKRLSEKLYIQYSLGLADKISVYSMQYLLGTHVVLEAKTDSQSRATADVLLTFEN